VRSFLVLILIGTLGFLVGCGSSGTPVGVVTSIALTPSSASLDAGQSVNITASVANDSSGKGVSWSLTGAGKLSNQTTTGATYTAPNPVTSIALPTVVATSIASSSVTASTPIVIAPAGTVTNVAPISVNGGPLTTANPPAIYTNAAFVSVLLCSPSNGACQTIPDILVDTGSFGLRLLASQVTVPLTPLTDNNGNTLYDCVQFVDNSFLWGAVAPANIVVGAELAASTSVQVIANPSFSIPSGCSGTNEDTQTLLGANGILGVGPEPFDCGLACDPSAGGTAPASPADAPARTKIRKPSWAQTAYWVWVPSRSTAVWPATRARAAQLQRFIIFAPPVVAATQHLSRAAPLVRMLTRINR